MSHGMDNDSFSYCITQADCLLSEFVREVQPMLVAIINRMPKDKVSESTIAVTNEIRNMNDHIARCFDDRKSIAEIEKELGKAEGHLQRVEYDVYKQMNWILYDKTIGWIEKGQYEHMNGWAELDWIDKYYELKNSIGKVVEEAKLDESSGKDRAFVLQKYKVGYDKYRELEELIMAKRRDFIKIRLRNVGFVTISILSLFFGSLVGFIIEALLDWLS